MARGAARARALFVCTTGALALLLGTADAQTQRTAAQAERDRRAETERAASLRARAESVHRDVRALDTRLVEAAQRRAETETAATGAQKRLVVTQHEIALSERAQRVTRSAIEAALIGAAFAERRIEPNAVRSAVAVRALGPAYVAQATAQARMLANAEQRATAIDTERGVLADAQAAIASEQATLVDLLARRRAEQTRLVSDASAAERRAQTLAREARTLRDLANRVQRAATRRSAPAGPSVVPASWVAPANGQITRAFGARDGGGAAAQGATVRTSGGAQVVSPAAGEVAYAGAFRSYRNVLILNLDGGYALVLTGIEALNVRVGETVRAGQTVGQMSAAASSAPELYVEVRRGGQPVDPGRWLSARGLSAAVPVRAG